MSSEKFAVRLNDVDQAALDTVMAHIQATSRWSTRSDAMRFALHHYARCIARGKQAGAGVCCALMGERAAASAARDHLANTGRLPEGTP